MPFVPILPSLGIFFNFTLAVHLDWAIWFFFGIFLAVGLVIYACYGLHNSKLEQNIEDAEYGEPQEPEYQPPKPNKID